MSTLATLEKGIKILSLFNKTTPALNVSDVATQLGLPKSTAYRYLAVLKKHGLIEEDTKPGTYCLGPKILELSQVVSRTSLRKLALPFMEQLARKTGETAILAGLRKHEGICLQKVEGHHALRVTHERGATFPLHAGATGKVLMAHLSQEEQNATIDDVGLPRFSETTITNPQRLRVELLKIKEQGFAESDGETILGSYSIAAPIFGRSGRIIAALSVSAPRHRLNDKKAQKAMIAMLVKTAQGITDKTTTIDVP